MRGHGVIGAIKIEFDLASNASGSSNNNIIHRVDKYRNHEYVHCFNVSCIIRTIL
jgi:hypothetical protein